MYADTFDEPYQLSKIVDMCRFYFSCIGIVWLVYRTELSVESIELVVSICFFFVDIVYIALDSRSIFTTIVTPRNGIGYKNLRNGYCCWEGLRGVPAEARGRRAVGLRRGNPRREAFSRQDTPVEGRVVPTQVRLQLQVGINCRNIEAS